MRLHYLWGPEFPSQPDPWSILAVIESFSRSPPSENYSTSDAFPVPCSLSHLSGDLPLVSSRGPKTYRPIVAERKHRQCFRPAPALRRPQRELRYFPELAVTARSEWHCLLVLIDSVTGLRLLITPNCWKDRQIRERRLSSASLHRRAQVAPSPAVARSSLDSVAVLQRNHFLPAIEKSSFL